MKTLLLENLTAILPNEKVGNANILIENGIIKEISTDKLSADETINLHNHTVYAGFIDVHIHGAVGVDVNESDTESLQKVGKYLAQQGTTAWLPTFVPDSFENYQKVINSIDELINIQTDLPIAQAVGVHYEGVFANEKMCGALRPQFFKTFTGKELAELPKLTQGVHFTTFAPEISGGIELTKELVKQNWVASIGHTNANFEILEKACDCGAKHITHFYNAMTGLHHRDIGVVGWAFGRKDVTCDIIADGIHVHPKMLEFAYKNKTADNLMLISDAISAAGLGDGDYEIWDEKISVVNGKTQNERGSIAGSVITMIDAVKTMLSIGISEVEVSKMASFNPAKLLKIEKDFGSIEVGKRADLVCLDKNHQPILSMVKGNIV
ncbi:MAG: N-acetylglucosamine-6-phosphate deacetylase [Pyrinomonadaceae bacterium]|nr:N-acetylglucosamine-6-phosphate deacetylase [Pyrinomonadaceae bacterium]